MAKAKAAVVTGSTSGIGLAIARALAREATNVMLNGFGDAGEIEKTRAEVERQCGVRALYSPADMTKPAEIAEMIRTAEQAFGGIDILVNNAGISLYRGIVECTEDDWDRHLNIMAKATFLTMRRLAPAMMERGWGRIVNLGSYVAQMNCTTKYFGPYCAAKFAVVGLTQVAAQEFAPAVTVNAVGPGDVDTDMMAREWELEGGRRGLNPAAVKEEYRERLILGRFERPDDIARAVLFLCSPLGDQVTGSHLIVSGGLPYHN